MAEGHHRTVAPGPRRLRKVVYLLASNSIRVIFTYPYNYTYNYTDTDTDTDNYTDTCMIPCNANDGVFNTKIDCRICVEVSNIAEATIVDHVDGWLVSQCYSLATYPCRMRHKARHCDGRPLGYPSGRVSPTHSLTHSLSGVRTRTPRPISGTSWCEKMRPRFASMHPFIRPCPCTAIVCLCTSGTHLYTYACNKFSTHR